MGFAWKFLLPLALLNVFVAGFYHKVSWQIGWPVGLIVLYGAAKVLERINHPKTISKRIYRYAE